MCWVDVFSGPDDCDDLYHFTTRLFYLRCENRIIVIWTEGKQMETINKSYICSAAFLFKASLFCLRTQGIKGKLRTSDFSL